MMVTDEFMSAYIFAKLATEAIEES
jgi:hypothetical protein